MAGRRRARKTYSASVDEFLKASPWLGPMDAPAVAALQNLAAQLDEDPIPAMVAQFGLTYRNLLKRAPGAEAEVDPIDALVDQARGA